MKIEFKNGKIFEYIDAYAMELDRYRGEIRPSIEIVMPLEQTSYSEIAEIVNNPELIDDFTLIGDPEFLEENLVLPTTNHLGYIYGDKITVENGTITFKKYGRSIAEFERDEAIKAIDELLISMEV